MLVDEINQCYIKMLFVESIKGEFIPNDDGIFSPILTNFQDRPDLLAQAAFDKYLKVMHIQSSLVQTEITRNHTEYALNTFINIAKSQPYDIETITIDQLVDIYLGF